MQVKHHFLSLMPRGSTGNKDFFVVKERENTHKPLRRGLLLVSSAGYK
jgi:hypothetical protein